MKAFNEWTREVASIANKPLDDELPEGLYLMSDGKIMATCKSCGNSYEQPCDVEDFNQDMSYCGRSDRCIP